MINYLILLSLIFIIGILIYLLFSIKNKETVDQGGNESLQNKLNEVSNDINKIEIDLASVTTPINELNRFLGGNVTTGRLGEWSLESIVQDIMPNNSYKFQDQINNESADRVDCSITTAEGFIVPIDSKFYAGQYQNFQSAGSDVERLFENITNILGNLMIGPLKKYRNISAAQVANSLVSKMSSDDDGVYVLDFENFKNQ